MNRLTNWIYSTYLGSLYLEFLLWVDSKKSKEQTKYLTPKEMAQVVRAYSLVDEGVIKMKNTVNQLINSKSKEEYQLLLSQIEDMLVFSEDEDDTPKAKLVESLRNLYVKKGNKDINTATERAKMIDKRIKDMIELQEDKIKRQLLRDIRDAEKQGNSDLANKLQMEFNNRYGRSHSRPRQS